MSVGQKEGFTLIELLIVIAIVGIFVAVSIPFIVGTSERHEFMQYCMSKGYTEQDCKWEWKRMQNGQAGVMPLMMRR